MFINLDWQKFEIEADAYCEVRCLELWAFQKMMRLFQVESGNDEENIEEIRKKLEKTNPLENPKLKEILPDILRAHARNLNGLEIKLPNEDQRSATIEDLVTIDQLMMLGIQILMQIFSISSIGGKRRNELKK